MLYRMKTLVFQLYLTAIATLVATTSMAALANELPPADTQPYLAPPQADSQPAAITPNPSFTTAPTADISTETNSLLAITELSLPHQQTAPSISPVPTTTISTPVNTGRHPESKALPTTQQRARAQPVATNSIPGNLSLDSTPLEIPTPQEMNVNAFSNLKQTAFPLSPEQIKTLRNLLDDTQRATAAAPYDSPPAPVSSSLIVNLSPGATPPAIRLYRGFVSSLVFVDSTGAPWPIVAYDLGNPSAFNIAWNNKDNLLMVQAQSSYQYGNLAVKLQDLDTPVMLTLVPGQRAVDYRVDLRIMGRGPNAKVAYSGSNIPASTSPVLLDILDAVPPQGAKVLQVPDATAQAWLYQDKLYLRTAYNLLSPAWVAKLSSADGMNAYELVKTPLVLLSRHGKTVQTKLEGF